MVKITHEAYNRLLAELNSSVGNKECPDAAKQQLSKVIDSKRKLCSIKTLQQLVRTLEDRDEISEQDVSLLKKIVELCLKINVNDEGFKRSYDLIVGYEKLHKEEGPSGLCSVCSAPTLAEFVIEAAQIQATAPSVVNSQDTGCEDPFSELRMAIQDIEDDIALDSWIKLARHLGVRKGKLDQLRGKYAIQGHNQTVNDMFDEWISDKGEEANIESLIQALEHKYVARKDLGLKLRKRYPK